MHAPPVLSPPGLAFAADGTPRSDRYDDSYHSARGAMGQARHVFLGGNGLPERWRGRALFTVLETGFGLGINFLATWQAWRDDARRPARLHMVSVEAHPLTRDDLERAHAVLAGDDGLSALAACLREAWPLALPGLHRIEFDGGAVVLTLAFGEAARILRRLALRADAIYLDGFAPARNPDMWSARVMSGVARLAAPGATLATYTAAGAVRDALVRAGFSVERQPGFAGKRHMTTGRRLNGRGGMRAPFTGSERTALVIGAGLAGCAVAHALGRRGWSVTVFDAATRPAMGASGNPAGVFHPVLARDDNVLSRLTRAAHLLTLHRWRSGVPDARAFRWSSCGALQLPERDGDELPPADAWPAEWARAVGADEARRLTGIATAHGGLWFPSGGWVDPGALCRAWLDGAGTRFIGGRSTASLVREDSAWVARDGSGADLGRAAACVVAAGLESRALLGLPEAALRAQRGQLTLVARTPFEALRACLCGGTYVVPGAGDAVVVGASHALDRADLAPDPADDACNLERLARLVPDLRTDVVGARVGIRAVTRDRLPLIGRMPGPPGRYAATGYGGRGILWSVLGAEVIAADLEGEPAPVETDLLAVIDPARVTT